VPGTTLVNDGSIFLVLAIWYACLPINFALHSDSNRLAPRSEQPTTHTVTTNKFQMLEVNFHEPEPSSAAYTPTLPRPACGIASRTSMEFSSIVLKYRAQVAWMLAAYDPTLPLGAAITFWLVT